MFKLFLLFAILPIVEIAILLNVGEQIGGWYTVAIVILTAFSGAQLVRQQGLSTLMQAQQKMQSGTMPGQEMAEGLLLVIAGILLVTPGFITDGIGFLLSLPMTRPIIAKGLLKHLSVKVVTQSFNGNYTQHQTHSSNQSEDIIEGEFERKENPAENLPLKDDLRKPD
ncbi:FxsA family protein [Paraglaciecola arctica]|uniref:FxsA family protein n=1 Tax=Paraglaciecola arctica TaxID=1128911 RepID=UPI001C067E33|nr:FxsA family protein [Paraglaciecola arctica]MBU3006232.1 FxsA family protein [Paraglaciecola arctica]